VKKLLSYLIISMILTLYPAISVFSEQNDDEDSLKELMEKTTPEERTDFQTTWMKETLTLSEDQEKKVREINLRYAKEMASLYESDDSKFKKLRKMNSSKNKKEDELKSLFSKEQFKMYKKKSDELKEKMNELPQKKKE